MSASPPVRILYVEDNPDDILLARRAFAGSPFQVEITIARDGEEALAAFRPTGDGGDAKTHHPDIVVLDLNLPKIQGLDVLRWIRTEQELPTPVIILSASSRPEDIAECYRLSCSAFFQKPVRYAEFAHLILVLQEYWLTYAKLPPRAASDSTNVAA